RVRVFTAAPVYRGTPTRVCHRTDGTMGDDVTLTQRISWIRDPDDEDTRRMEEEARQLEARSDAEWWEEDHSGKYNHIDGHLLDRALNELRSGCGCDVGRLLS